MNSFVEDFKYAWNRPNNALIKLIILNVCVFVLINLVWFISTIAKDLAIYEFAKDNLAIPSAINQFVFKPWTLITYFFTHQDFFHILFNMLIMYWFGLIIQEFLGSKKLVALYILGGMAGGVAFLLMYNLIPFFIERGPVPMLGASAAVYAIVIGAAAFMPEYRMSLILLGPVKIKYIAAVYIFLSFIGTTGANAGGNIAHLGGALIGFVFIKQLQKGDDWSKPISNILDSIAGLFKGRSKMKVTYKKGASVKTSNAKASQPVKPNGEPDQAIVDAILDKISESGYEKLTTEEKQILFKASQKKS
ncbi:rhomboid family intramembrane serine protease [Flammeovirgaceae bacterium SG7u.111]|nr:rhomboid family intramembrane serine protease [Flammeovirgaceae bacterium SG7u.132]WPO35761.1 rhomboid family intramembrane serine protease [Flammeovirgaceae bacterium SG7u.111]